VIGTDVLSVKVFTSAGGKTSFGDMSIELSFLTEPVLVSCKCCDFTSNSGYFSCSCLVLNLQSVCFGMKPHRSGIQ